MLAVIELSGGMSVPAPRGVGNGVASEGDVMARPKFDIDDVPPID